MVSTTGIHQLHLGTCLNMKNCHLAESKKLRLGSQSEKKTFVWDSDAILQGSLENVLAAPSNVVKIYVLSTKSGKVYSGNKRHMSLT